MLYFQFKFRSLYDACSCSPDAKEKDDDKKSGELFCAPAKLCRWLRLVHFSDAPAPDIIIPPFEKCAKHKIAAALLAAPRAENTLCNPRCYVFIFANSSFCTAAAATSVSNRSAHACYIFALLNIIAGLGVPRTITWKLMASFSRAQGISLHVKYYS